MTKIIDTKTLDNLSRPTRFSIPGTRGLHLLVKKNGSKFWIYRYAINKQRYDLGLGSYPDVSLIHAKREYELARAKIIQGINPLDDRRDSIQLRIDTNKVKFKKFALEYIEIMRPKWTNDKHASQWIATLQTYVFPSIGNLTMDEINTEHIIELLSKIWNTKSETAHRVRGRIDRIISAAISRKLRTESNPATWKGHLENLLPPRNKIQKHRVALPYKQIPEFINKLREIKCMSALALEFTILNASRTGEVIYAKWEEIDGDIWTIPAERMKSRTMHQVPLGMRSLEILELTKEIENESGYIFHRKITHISNMSMMMLIRRMKFKITTHGFRSSFRDFVANETNHSPEVAEGCLHHAIPSKVERAYRRGKMLERRRRLLQDWESYCLTGDFDPMFKANY